MDHSGARMGGWLAIPRVFCRSSRRQKKIGGDDYVGPCDTRLVLCAIEQQKPYVICMQATIMELGSLDVRKMTIMFVGNILSAWT